MILPGDMLFNVQDGMFAWQPGTISIFAFYKNGDGSFGIAPPVEWKVLTKEEMNGGLQSPIPTLSMNRTSGQLLMDELWKVGLRPSEGTGSAGSLAATQRHLEDMRAIAFKKAGVDQPAAKR